MTAPPPPPSTTSRVACPPRGELRSFLCPRQSAILRIESEHPHERRSRIPNTWTRIGSQQNGVETRSDGRATRPARRCGAVAPPMDAPSYSCRRLNPDRVPQWREQKPEALEDVLPENRGRPAAELDAVWGTDPVADRENAVEIASRWSALWRRDRATRSREHRRRRQGWPARTGGTDRSITNPTVPVTVAALLSRTLTPASPPPYPPRPLTFTFPHHI